MISLLTKQTKVLDKGEDIVNDIKLQIQNKFNLNLSNEVIVNIISSQSYLAFNLGVKNGLDVRFPRLGAFKVNQKAKHVNAIYKLVLSECNGDEVLAKATMKTLKEKYVFQDFKI